MFTFLRYLSEFDKRPKISAMLRPQISTIMQVDVSDFFTVYMFLSNTKLLYFLRKTQFSWGFLRKGQAILYLCHSFKTHFSVYGQQNCIQHWQAI